MNLQPCTVDECYQYVSQRIFQLRPPDYGVKFPQWPGTVGIEVEMLPIQSPNVSTKGVVPEIVTLPKTKAVLQELAASSGWTAEMDDQQLKMIQLDQGSLTFEPGGQVEFSSKPFPCLSDALKSLYAMQGMLDKKFAEQGIELFQGGINPWHRVEEIGLQMDKPRYRAMNDYYQNLSDYGQRMMRQTMTIQVNLDFGSTEEVMVKRYLLSQLLAPVSAAMFAYSCQYDNQQHTLQGFRQKVWQYTDPTHTGLVGVETIARELSFRSCVQSYLDFALNAHVIYDLKQGFQPMWQPGGPYLTFRQWMEGTSPSQNSKPTLNDFVEHLSLLFPEVRPKGFIEIRSIDGQSRVWQQVPCLFYCGLLYDDRSLDQALDLLLPEAGKTEARLRGAQAGLKDAQLAELCKKISEIAISGYSRLPSCFKEETSEKVFAKYVENFVGRGQTPSDELIRITRQKGEESASLQTFRELEATWLTLVQ